MTITPTAGVPDRAPGQSEQGSEPDLSAATEFMAALAAVAFPTAHLARLPAPVPSSSQNGGDARRWSVHNDRHADRVRTGPDPVRSRGRDLSDPSADRAQERSGAGRAEANDRSQRVPGQAHDARDIHRERAAPDHVAADNGSLRQDHDGRVFGTMTDGSPRLPGGGGVGFLAARTAAEGSSLSSQSGLFASEASGAAPGSFLRAIQQLQHPDDGPTPAGNLSAEAGSPAGTGAVRNSTDHRGVAVSPQIGQQSTATSPSSPLNRQSVTAAAAVGSASAATAANAAAGAMTVRPGTAPGPATAAAPVEPVAEAAGTAWKSPQAGAPTVLADPRVSRSSRTGAGQGPDPDHTRTVADQVIRHLTAMRTLRDGTHRTVLNLSPEHLGTVQVTVDLFDGRISLRMTAGDAALAALRQDMADLRGQLATVGLELGDVDLRSSSTAQQQGNLPPGQQQAQGSPEQGQGPGDGAGARPDPQPSRHSDGSLSPGRGDALPPVRGSGETGTDSSENRAEQLRAQFPRTGRTPGVDLRV